MEGKQGSERRQIEVAEGKGLIEATISAEWNFTEDEFLCPEPSWLRFLSGCSNIRATGCVLCWVLVAGSSYRGWDPSRLTFFKQLAQRLTAGSMTSQARAAPGVFPLREGELSKVRTAMNFTEFKKVVDPGFVAEWHQLAWVYVLVFGLNSLYGSVAAPQLGRWTKAEKRSISALHDLVSRRCHFDDELFPEVEKIGKDLSSKFVGYSSGYSGEEISKCYPLTLEQILPSLPPESHGGSIEAVEWLGARSRHFLLHPEQCLLEES